VELPEINVNELEKYVNDVMA